MSMRRRVAKITSSLSFRLFLVLFLSILFLFAVHAAVISRVHAGVLEQQVKRDAYRASDFIRQSLYESMLRNERERMYAQIALLGAEPGIEAIRIYNKRGEIRYSNHEGEIETSVDLQAEACYVCHATAQPLEAVPTEERARIYRKEGDYRVLGLINPIRNEEGCWNASCHAHTSDQSVLGVLDVQMSMEELDRSLARSDRLAFALVVGIIVLSLLVMAMIVYRAVHVPTRKLRVGTEALAAGDLDVEIDLDRSDELGALAASFNQMARNLAQADAELREWSQTLEDRVQEKTEQLEAMHQQMIMVEKTASLGKMAATVAHELNNPLAGILTYAKLIRRRVQKTVSEGHDKERMLARLEMIQSEAVRCGRIVQDLLTYARKGSAEFRQVHLHELVDRALGLVGHHIELGQVRTERELELEDDRVVVDPEQIIQALIALLINAVEAMPDGGTVTVGTAPTPRARAGRVLLTIKDTGIGIPQDVRNRIFDPFFSTKSEAKGVGLGLAVVYGIIQRHEGAITVDSEPGEGTTFSIELPRAPSGTLADRAPDTVEATAP
jgi:two-component system NtrC family sensor kinase